MYKRLIKKIYFLYTHNELLKGLVKQSIIPDEYKFYEFVRNLSCDIKKEFFSGINSISLECDEIGSVKWYITEILYGVTKLLNDEKLGSINYRDYEDKRNFILWYSLRCSSRLLLEILETYKCELSSDATQLVMAKIEYLENYSKFLYSRKYKFHKLKQYADYRIEKYAKYILKKLSSTKYLSTK